ncbi:molybdopterin molybdotransferase MoeA [Bosea sp. F3-2]|uniref:molybdopterin molybdotransferase MoeA n=1 Tax=Bosea sp. F3-2 TaxID=2599640 RepID=UPI0011F08249|nr:gephyrin-like molybdotransferase Glp [Bosea sp. F3-2]QEL23322.1 molybdopterin molybdotransferase MoeA [Bosea sp. F3-2]
MTGRPGGAGTDIGLISLDEAGARAAACVEPVPGVLELPLVEADGRVLAEAVIAPIDLPPFANSAVDGYAVRYADLLPDAETSLPLLGRTAAGDPVGRLGHGAWRIFTGAPAPDGADTVVMQENVRLNGGEVILPSGLKRGANLRPAGEDVARGQEVLPAGRRLRPPDLGLLAALGLERVRVRQRPRVALFSTGDELTEPGQPLKPAAIYDANRAMLRALLARAGADVADLGILRDEPANLERHLREAAGACDLIVTSGGVSVGEEDHVKAALSACGSLDLWRVAIKPGKPIAIGEAAGTPFIGLPGNPVAVFVGFVFVARPLLARLAGAVDEAPVVFPVTAGFHHRKKAGRREFLRATLERRDDGAVIARKHPGEGAGSLASLAQSDGLVVLAENLEQLEEGSSVPFLPYAGLLG